MPQYVIPDFSMGLVDIDAQAKLDKSYKQKCSELKNFIIAPDNTLRRRPPLKEVSTFAEAKGAIDFIDSGVKRLFLCNVQVADLSALPSELRKYLYPEALSTGPLPEYTLTEDGLRASATTNHTVSGRVVSSTWEMKANVQRIVVYNKETGAYLPNESYYFAAFYHDSQTADGSSLFSKRAEELDPAYPDRVVDGEVQEPGVFVISKGNAVQAVTFTMPYKRAGALEPSQKAGTDMRFVASDTLNKAPNGTQEYLFTDKNPCSKPIKQISQHLTEGVTFSFAGTRYTLSDGLLKCLVSKRLFPTLSALTVDTLKGMIPSKRFDSDVTLPVKALYLPTQATGGTRDHPYAKDTVKSALTANLIKSSESTGEARQLETLLSDNKTKGYTLDALRGAVPELGPVLDNLRTVLGLYESTDGTKYIYPDIKYLAGSADFSRLNEATFLYREGSEDRTAVILTTVPRLGWDGANEAAVPRNSFPNGNGYAADGVGVSIAIYKNIPGNPDNYQITQSAPDGIFYLFIDYAAEEVKNYFQETDVVSGFSAAFLKYRSWVAKLGSSAAYDIEANTTMGDIIADDNAFFTSSSTSELAASPTRSDFLSTSAAWTNLIALGWPVGLKPESIKKFGVPCFIQSLNAKDSTITYRPTGEAIGGNGFASEVDELPFDNANPALIAYIHNPRLYQGADYSYANLPGRGAIYFENNLYLSQVLNPENYNNHIVSYFNSITNGTRDRLVLRASGLEGQFVAPIIGDPQIFSFKAQLGGKDNIVTIEGADRDSIYLGTENAVLRALPGSFLRQAQFSTISRSGITSPIISESSYNIAAAGDRLLIMKYYEEAKGVIADILAPDIRVFDTIDQVAQLISKHKLLFFYKRDSNRMFVGAMDKERLYKGLSMFEFSKPIHLVKQINPDTLGVLHTDGTYGEMAFNTTKDTDFRDLHDGKDVEYTSSVTSLPVAFAGETSFSTSRTISIGKVSVGVAGFLDLELSVIDDITGVKETVPVRYVNKNNVAEVKQYGGFWTIESLPTTGCVSPRIQLTCKGNKYTSLSSVILEVR